MLKMDFVLAIAEDQVPSTKAPDPYMHVFLDAGNGNVLAFFELPTQPPMGRDPNTPDWVQHIAFKVKDRAELLAFKAHLEANGVEVLGVTDHGTFHSIYFFDPNGHRVELAANTGTRRAVPSSKRVAPACWTNGAAPRRRRGTPPGCTELEFNRRISDLPAMKLASLKTAATAASLWSPTTSPFPPTPPTSPRRFSSALDDWDRFAPQLRELATDARAPTPSPPRPLPTSATAPSPLPRAYQWADGSAYVNHVELVRKARGAEMPESFWTDPLMYQGGSDVFLGPRDPIPLADEAWGCDFEAEVAVVTGDVPQGASREEALRPHPPRRAGQRRRRSAT